MPTLFPVMEWQVLMALHMVQAASKVAPGYPLPVEVLMKSAPEYMARMDAFWMFSVVTKAPVSKITFKWAWRQLSLISCNSSVNSSKLSSMKQPRFMTTSISSAPCMTAMAVSAILTSVNVCEEGKPPATDAILTSCAVSACLTVSTNRGQTQIAATFGTSGRVPSKSFTVSTIFQMFSLVSRLVNEVKSMQP